MSQATLQNPDEAWDKSEPQADRMELGGMGSIPGGDLQLEGLRRPAVRLRRF